MCIQFGSVFASRVLHREALPLRDAAASGPDGVTLLGIDHFSATKLVDYAWSLLLTRAAADDLRSWSNDLLLMAVCDHFVHRYSRTCTRALLGKAFAVEAHVGLKAMRSTAHPEVKTTVDAEAAQTLCLLKQPTIYGRKWARREPSGWSRRRQVHCETSPWPCHEVMRLLALQQT